ncbi:MAG: penicillin-binding protein 1A [bacterium]|nr:penicillin-binding protein 1A [bacterium]
MKVLKTIILSLIVFILIFIIAGSIFTLVVLLEYIPKLPDPSLLLQYNPPTKTTIYDAKGLPLAELYAEKRIIIPIKDIPQHLKDAVVAIEDERFYSHAGVDLRGIARALYRAIKSGEIREGGSTITQQLARNVFLTLERTPSRKIMEMLLALRIETTLSKEEILHLYLNIIYFGEGCYGIESAARTYFDKSAKNLNLAESALLAGIIRSPENYSPFKNKNLAIARQRLVLKKMLELGFIDEKDYKSALNTELKFSSGKDGFWKAPYFIDYVLNILKNDLGFRDIEKSGLNIYTTLDLDVQKIAEEVLSDGLKRAKDYNVSQGALVLIENSNGYIRAMVGGRNYKESQFNRVVQAYRQPGSAFKPFVYTVAIQDGWKPEDTIVDEEISFKVGNKIWKPQNYDKRFRGTITLKDALAYSVNIPAVKLLYEVGVDKVLELTIKMGLPLDYTLDRNLAIALGGITKGVTPLQLVQAFSVWANRGVLIKPIAIKVIKDKDGRILYNSEIKNSRILDEDVTKTITEMLENVIKYGTGKRANCGHPCAGKTGTTSDYRDAWFVGFTRQYTACVWMGNDDNSPMKGVTGGMFPAEVWGKFMGRILSNTQLLPLFD